MDYTLDNFKHLVENEIIDELNNRETFSPEIQKQIRETYERLYKEREEWLKKQQAEQ
jgi:hypothetical protein